METNCKCSLCQNACLYKLGRFMPVDIYDLQDYFKKPWEQMLGNEIAID